MKQTVILCGPRQRQTAHEYIDNAPVGYIVEISEPKKKRIQEEKYHAQIRDIAKQTTYAGQKWDKDDMKRIMIDEFAEEMRNAGTPLRHDGRLIPSENGRRVIQLGIQSRDFSVREGSEFITFLYSYGDERGVQWTEPVAEVA